MVEDDHEVLAEAEVELDDPVEVAEVLDDPEVEEIEVAELAAEAEDENKLVLN